MSPIDRPRRLSACRIRLLIEAEGYLVTFDENGPANEIGLLHHQVDRLLFRTRQRPLLEDRAPGADEIQEPVRIDMLLEKGPGWRVLVDVVLFDVHTVLFQKTSGVAARGSG